MAQSKADELAQTFPAKSQLLLEETNAYTIIEPVTSNRMLGLCLEVRDARKLLERLDGSSGTGPDMLLSRMRKRCADAVSLH